MIRVDELRVQPNATGIFTRGSAHLTADTLEELHAFAKKLGMRREWFQDHRLLPHYDLTPQRYARALKMGAVLVPMKDQLRDRRRAKRLTPEVIEATLRKSAPGANELHRKLLDSHLRMDLTKLRLRGRT